MLKERFKGVIADRRGVGVLFMGAVMLLFIYMLLGYSLYVSQLLLARGALLKATLAAAKAGAYQVDVNVAQHGGKNMDRRAVERAAEEAFAGNLPPVLQRRAGIKNVTVNPRLVKVRAKCSVDIMTPLGPRRDSFETECRAVPRSIRRG
ncbi:hypothetical protein [Desulfofundulus thermosubterraneus]|uniref:Flp pilus-assembly TadE/G-like n=1 Tax=Desulfofundulus thermosubterraneus DSM 16057 TaxID=1121432 RepID=A0A1M6JAG7_9FIRM|nr:hypothetical protein [Desulfofundulus thermosubterraneus]SHJ43681.1 hypothetical protein SAMN02745219_02557 [Desulfofundulus thermosubterraneus DSM 16057]